MIYKNKIKVESCKMKVSIYYHYTLLMDKPSHTT